MFAHSQSVHTVVYIAHSQSQAWKEEGCGSLTAIVKFNHFIMNVYTTI